MQKQFSVMTARISKNSSDIAFLQPHLNHQTKLDA
jgi:hypothetical protein